MLLLSMNKEIKLISDALNNIYIDLYMLKDGTWFPDKHSVNDTLDELDIIKIQLKELNILSDNFDFKEYE